MSPIFSAASRGPIRWGATADFLVRWITELEKIEAKGKGRRLMDM